jgi:hypothetical protein
MVVNSGLFGQPGRAGAAGPGRPPKERSISNSLEKAFKQARGEDSTAVQRIADRVVKALETGWMDYDKPEGIILDDLMPKDDATEDDGGKKKQRNRKAMRIQEIDANLYSVFLGPDAWIDLFKFVVNHTDGPVRAEQESGEGITVIWNMPLVQIPQELMQQIPQSDRLLLPEIPQDQNENS